jgi:hypothetical protein
LIWFKNKEWLILFLVSLLPYLFVLVKPELIGADTFANFNYVCGIGTYEPPQIWSFVLHLFPCNVFAIKLIEFFSYFIVTVVIALFGKHVFGEDGWKLGVFAVGLCPLLFQISLNFEAQWFGFVIAFIGFVGFILINGEDKQ